MKKIIYFLAIALAMVSCEKKVETVRYTIASRTADCTGVAPQQCLLVKKGDMTDWEYFYSTIEGFNFEEGYEYVLDVKEEKLENVPADASSIKYVLVNEVSKTAKTSENLPAIVDKKPVIQLVGKVLSIENNDIGQGAAQGRFPVIIVEVQVSNTTSDKFKEGDVVYCELVPSPTVMPEVGREYVFKAKEMHPAHAKGIYLLETNVQDLVV